MTVLRKLSFALLSLVFLIFGVFPTAFAQDEEFVFNSELAENWYRAGDYFSWTSTTADNKSARVNVFYRLFGDETKPKLLLVHGFPNSSFDYYKMIPLLEDEYHIGVLDFPGSGFSDKPQGGFSYMLEDNAMLLDYFVREIVGFEDFALFTHDRGVSIGLAFLGNYIDKPNPGYTINYHFMSNSGMFLPLANLVPFQLALQDAERGPRLIGTRKAQPRRTQGNPEDVAFSDIFAFNDGVGALLYVGRYLLERKANELGGLTTSPEAPCLWPTSGDWPIA